MGAGEVERKLMLVLGLPPRLVRLFPAIRLEELGMLDARSVCAANR